MAGCAVMMAQAARREAVELVVTAPFESRSVRCRATLATSNGSAFEAYMDQTHLENLSLLIDGFESGTTDAWSVTVP